MPPANPYQPPNARMRTSGTRPVRLLVMFGFAVAAAAVLVALPGAYLFNQEAQLFPVNRFVYDIQIGEVTITNTAVIAFSGTICFCLWSMAAGLWGLARRNHSLNQRSGTPIQNR